MKSILSKFQELVKTKLDLVKTYQSDIVLALCVVMLTVISFNLGKISANNSSLRPATTVEGDSSGPTANLSKLLPTANVKKAVIRTDLSVIASKKSTSKLYHFSWCSGAKQISDANKLTFATEQEAISAGYHLASNCSK